jgi:hypothetical protein
MILQTCSFYDTMLVRLIINFSLSHRNVRKNILCFAVFKLSTFQVAFSYIWITYIVVHYDLTWTFQLISVIIEFLSYSVIVHMIILHIMIFSGRLFPLKHPLKINDRLVLSTSDKSSDISFNTSNIITSNTLADYSGCTKSSTAFVLYYRVP